MRVAILGTLGSRSKRFIHFPLETMLRDWRLEHFQSLDWHETLLVESLKMNNFIIRKKLHWQQLVETKKYFSAVLNQFTL